MWWHKSQKLVTRTATIAALALTLSACFRPLYGPTASGEHLDSVLSSIEVAEVATAPVYERVGHYLRNELIFDLNGSGLPHPKRYKLALSFSESVRSPIVESTTGRAQSATLIGTVNYRLLSLDGKKVVTEGTATGYASYDRTPQRFATVRAARDADIRLAKSLSEQIRTRLSVALATAG
jgi:LPS-assembly lipoprotein